jgi:hypothetical protein
MTAVERVAEATGKTGREPAFGIRPDALSSWHRLSAALLQLADLGVHTPCDDDPEAFVGEDLGRRLVAAKACGLCPALVPCGAFATLNRERLGVWGGSDRTWGARAALRRRLSAGDASGWRS